VAIAPGINKIMKNIFFNKQRNKLVALTLNRRVKALLTLCVLGIPLGVGVAIGAAVTDRSDELVVVLDALEVELVSQKEVLAQGRIETEHKLAAYSSKLGEMQARLVRLDALGERITDIAGLASGEFDFASSPAMGGPDDLLSQYVDQADFELFYRQLDAQLIDRERQLGLLRMMMTDRQFKQESTVSGRPVEKGWMSSAYGMRYDPFHGRKRLHKGVDFAGQDGSPVIAVAAGIIISSEVRKGYGNTIDVDHGDGLVARYAHNRKNLVKVGDLVKKGQVIALMGSSGRSTGPHVHFELQKNGRHIDPSRYVWRTVNG